MEKECVESEPGHVMVTGAARVADDSEVVKQCVEPFRHAVRFAEPLAGKLNTSVGGARLLDLVNQAKSLIAELDAGW